MVIEACLNKTNDEKSIAQKRLCPSCSACHDQFVFEKYGHHMKGNAEQLKVKIFFGSLILVASAVNVYFFRPAVASSYSPRVSEPKSSVSTPPVVIPPTPRPATQEDLAAKRQRFAAQFYNTSFSPKASETAVAIVVADENGKANLTVGKSLAAIFGTGDTKAMTWFFKTDFLSTGVFQEIFDGSNEFFEKLDLSKTLAAVVLGIESVNYTHTPSLENLITAHMDLKVVKISLTDHLDRTPWTYTATGAGFSESEARSKAEKQILEQLGSDKTLGLNK